MDVHAVEADAQEATTRPLPPVRSTSWRYFLIRDGLTVLSLTLVALLLGAVTTFLFRSFQAHQEKLAQVWAKQGTAALQRGQAAQAVAALRTSLSYKPEDRETQLMLAQALEASGHLNEAENYFLTLWDTEPGNGSINLQLARLERSRGDASAAINYYRAAVFGTWDGDAPMRRRDARLELCQYLNQRGEHQAARSELLIAASNNTDSATQLLIAQDLEEANDPADAITAYRNAMANGPDRAVAEAKAGELCYRMGNYACADELLAKALRAKRWQPEQVARMTALEHDAELLQQLAFGPAIPEDLRATHLLADAHMVQSRLKVCIAQHADVLPEPLQEAQARWKTLDSPHTEHILRNDEGLQQQYAKLIEDTETVATQVCGPATGEDALLVYLRDHPVTQFGAVRE